MECTAEEYRLALVETDKLMEDARQARAEYKRVCRGSHLGRVLGFFLDVLFFGDVLYFYMAERPYAKVQAKARALGYR
jgi:hypothetical protein